MLHTSFCAPSVPARSGEQPNAGGQGTLVAILLNAPSTTTGTRSLNAVRRASNVLGYERALVANLFAVSTPSVVQLNDHGRDGWDLARDDLAAALCRADALLAGWGVAGLTGDTRRWMCAQVEWLSERAVSCGISRFWTVGGEPRHPSRWHQFVSDKYGRTSGGTFDQRIAQVLVEVPIDSANVAKLLRHSSSGKTRPSLLMEPSA